MQQKKVTPWVSKLTLSWLNFDTFQNEIRNLRKAVFVEEQGIGEFMIDSPGDPTGLHLGLFDGDLLVACVSIYPYENNHEFIRSTVQLDFNQPYGLQFSRRVELAAYRSKKLSSLMLAHGMHSTCEYFQPDCVFATLVDRHKVLRNFYISTYKFNRCLEFSNDEGDGLLLVMDRQSTIDEVAEQLKAESVNLSERLDIELPDLNKHISQHSSLEKYWSIKGDLVNRYLSPLSLQDELPRLSAQARMLFKSQKEIWDALLAEYNDHQTILDLGCGPGIYMAQLNKLDKMNGRQLMGMDISNELITYARFSHSDLDWKIGSVYNTKLESDSVDIIHCSFLFIHLINPLWALQEIYRILAPGGLLYISDVNDSTFKGPKQIQDLIESHSEIYEGNREVMSSIEELTDKVGLKLIMNDRLLVDNTGTDQSAELDGRHFRLGKWAMWAMFSFMGQREEVREQFEQADVYYFDYDSTISIEIHTKIFKKEQ
ncbi:class I SAM-dependent methyltransferase [Membranicola marinus]|uniref:Class I SAM-dependent methyltransferase n=1 Tax=Membranihabitans marinus TaxID=1227546 RepID=A0A953L615_9BACT|nr:class I SAM-dependent methyltransferase [Membranihabitans marinus]MBY5957177.1 class I SAM-dependent methyltransferase [Membranihabitans marinus]